MRKLITGILMLSSVALFLQSCETRKVVVNREVETTSDGKMLLGTQTLDQFYKEPYSAWYNQEYENYQIDQESVAQLKKQKLNSYNILVFLGTWCGDSHREFPRLIRILDELKYPKNKLTIVAVNRKKESPNGEEGQYNIQRVPTIIVKKYGKEIGRIIESPKTGWLEKDLLDILKKDDSSVKDLLKD